jgi:hypothetical protein
MRAQDFFVEVHHDNPFSTVGSAVTSDYDAWFEIARQRSLEYPDQRVHCTTLARVRRIYRNGQVESDCPDWPYLGQPGPGQRW